MITPLEIGTVPPAGAPQPLNDDQRRRLGLVADVLIPGDPIMPSATAVGTQHLLIDRAIAARPDLLPSLIAVLDAVPDTAKNDEIVSAVDGFAEENEEAFTGFGQLLKGAYFLEPSVRASIGYPGQEARPVSDDSDTYFDILSEVVERGEIYRPTPSDE